MLREYLQSDIAEPSASARELMQRAQGVLLCTPEEAVLKAIPVVQQLLAPDGLALDIASVKSRIDAALKAVWAVGGYLSIHPMFGPTADFASRNV